MYMRISDANNAWLNSLAAASRLPKAAIADLIFTTAREAGWEVRPGDAPAVVIPARPGRPSPAAGPATPEAGNDHE